MVGEELKKNNYMLDFVRIEVTRKLTVLLSEDATLGHILEHYRPELRESSKVNDRRIKYAALLKKRNWFGQWFEVSALAMELQELVHETYADSMLVYTLNDISIFAYLRTILMTDKMPDEACNINEITKGSNEYRRIWERFSVVCIVAQLNGKANWRWDFKEKTSISNSQLDRVVETVRDLQSYEGLYGEWVRLELIKYIGECLCELSLMNKNDEGLKKMRDSLREDYRNIVVPSENPQVLYRVVTETIDWYKRYLRDDYLKRVFPEQSISKS